MFFRYFLVLCCACFSLHADEVFHRTGDIEEVFQILSEADSQDLIIFDVDEVLIVPKDKILRPNAGRVCYPVFDRLFFPTSDEEKTELFGHWIHQIEVEVVHPKIVEGIWDLQEKGHKIITLTLMLPGPGPCGPIGSMEDFRFHELKERGFDFSGSLEVESLKLSLDPKHGRVPLFKNGILFSYPYPKGPSLGTFLEQIDFVPSKIWFVDNDQRNVDSVAKMAQAKNIPYVGIRYLDQKFEQEDFDEEIGLFQYDHFERTKIWLDDASAQERK
ncbi:MAG: DUF2608 domain-containing protein [Verrucomicrobia bacterium]|nr:DUF2608 domain-containing protein [Verrucomicrobiota bacterium]